MEISANELTATVQKAARGAGWPLGPADDLAAAAGWLSATGEDAVAAALAALTGPPGPEPAAIDLAIAEGRAVLRAPHPDLLKAYAAIAERAYGEGFALTFDGADAVIEPGAPPSPPPPAIRRVKVEAEAWAKLTALAAKTYVPASAASRAAGAGAGDIDND